MFELAGKGVEVWIGELVGDFLDAEFGADEEVLGFFESALEAVFAGRLADASFKLLAEVGVAHSGFFSE